MISHICFSRNRSFQLSEHLRTIGKYVRGIDKTHVVYAADLPFRNSYTAIAEAYPAMAFHDDHADGGFYKCLLATLEACQDPYIFLTVDDAFFFKAIDLRSGAALLAEREYVYSVQIRLAPNLDYCHPAQAHQIVPGLAPIDGTQWCLFHRSQGTFDWAYPWEVSCSLYRREDVVVMLKRIENCGIPENPNQVEAWGSQQIQGLPPMTACCTEQTMVLITINRTQDMYRNPIFARSYRSPETLDQLFREGQKLDDEFYARQRYNSVCVGDFYLAPRA